MAADKPKRISGQVCSQCGKTGSEVLEDGSHRCRYCGCRWTPGQKK